MGPNHTARLRIAGLHPGGSFPRTDRGLRHCVLLVLALVLTATFAMVPAGPAEAAETTVSNPAAISIPDSGPASPYPSTVAVSGATGAVSDVTVTLTDLSHFSFNDIDAMLVAPTGANLVFLSDAAGPTEFTFANNATLTFSDAATEQLPESGAVDSGTYRPQNNETGLEDMTPPAPPPSNSTSFDQAFTGIEPNGNWSLYVFDDVTGDSGSIAGGWSLSITTTVAGTATTTEVSSSTNPSETGQSVTFTATVTADGADPAGTVTFTADDEPIGSPVSLDAAGTASVTTDELEEGTHLIRASYSGADGFLPSHGTLSQVVDFPTTVTDSTYCNAGPIDTGNNSTGSPYPSRINVEDLNGSITQVTASLSDFSHTAPVDAELLLAGPDPTRNVVLISDAGGTSPVTDLDLSFDDEAASAVPADSLTTGTFRPTDDDVDGADVFPAPAPAPAGGSAGLAIFDGAEADGTWSLYVVDDAAGDSGSIAGGWCLTFTVATPTDTTVSAAPNPAEYGQPVTLTATVAESGGDGDPVTSGQVEFFDGTTSLGSASVADGVATLRTAGLPLGRSSITAVYQPDGNYQTSTSAPITVEVLPATTTTEVSAVPNPATLDQQVVLTATVTSHGDPVTGGTVSFEVGGNPVGSGSLNGSGQAEFIVPARIAGGQLVTATFAGWSGYQPSSGLASSYKLSTTTTVGTAPQPSEYGERVTLTATVMSGADPVTEGSVRFTVDGGDPLPDLPLGPDGTAALPVDDLGVGDHTVTARYLGNDLFATSTGDASHTVGKAATATVVTADPTSTAFGQPVTFTASVTSATGAAATGDVTFTIDGTVVGTEPVDADGEAAFSTSDLSVGDHDVVATYAGSATLQSSQSPSVSHTVTRAVTSVNLTAAPNPAELGQQIELAAEVTSGGSAITAGTVTFSDGSTVLGAAPVGDGGVATFSTSDLEIGTHPITATYEQSASHAAGSSAPVDVVVTRITTAVALTSDPAEPAVGDQVTYTAQVTAGPDPVTDGRIRILVNGQVAQDATAVDGRGRVQFTMTVNTAADRTITAEYLGTERYAPSSKELTQTDRLGSTVTTLASQTNPATFGIPVTFTATVATGTQAAEPVSNGTVTFTVDGEPAGTIDLDEDGSAAVEMADLSAGDHLVRAVFNGNDNYAASEDVISQHVDPAATEIRLTADPASPSVDGAAVTVTATVTAGDDAVAGGSVRLTVDGQDPMQPVPVNEEGRARLRLGRLSSGSYLFTVEYLPDRNHLASTQTLSHAVDPNADPGGAYTVDEGAALALDGSGSTAGAELRWDLDGDGDFDDATGARPSLSWARLQELGIDDGPATHSLVLQAAEAGRTSTNEVRLSVQNTAPTTIIEGPSTITAGRPITLKIGADDPSAADAAAMFTYTVDWGDGSPIETVTGPADPPVTHVYSAAGTMTATFSATDRDGGQGESSSIQITVAPAAAPTSPPSTATPTPGGPTPPEGSATPSGPADPTAAPTADPSDSDPPADGGSLPDTGSGVGLPLLIGAWLLVISGGLVLALSGRLRRRQPTSYHLR